MKSTKETTSPTPLMNNGVFPSNVCAGAEVSVGTPTTSGKTWKTEPKKGFKDHQEVQQYYKKVHDVDAMKLYEILRLCGDDQDLALIMLARRYELSTPPTGQGTMTLEELKNMHRNMLDYGGRKRFDSWTRGNEVKLHKACMKWLNNKRWDKGLIAQAVIAFLLGEKKNKVVQMEKVPPEFEKCGYIGCKDEVHYGVDGTPIPSHNPREIREYTRDLPDEEFDVFPKQNIRLWSFNVVDPLIPTKSSGKYHEVRACYTVCRFWRLAYAGLIPAWEVGDVIFNELILTYNNKGFVNEDRMNVEFNKEFASGKFKGPVPVWFPAKTAFAICEEIGLRIETYDEYLAGRFPMTNTDEDLERCNAESRVEEITMDDDLVIYKPKPMEIDEIDYSTASVPEVSPPPKLVLEPFEYHIPEVVDCVPPEPIVAPNGFLGGHIRSPPLQEEDFQRLAAEPLTPVREQMTADEIVLVTMFMAGAIPPEDALLWKNFDLEWGLANEFDVEKVAEELMDVDDVSDCFDEDEIMFVLEEPSNLPKFDAHSTTAKTIHNGTMLADYAGESLHNFEEMTPSEFKLEVTSCLAELEQMEYEKLQDPLDWDLSDTSEESDDSGDKHWLEGGNEPDAIFQGPGITVEEEPDFWVGKVPIYCSEEPLDVVPPLPKKLKIDESRFVNGKPIRAPRKCDKDLPIDVLDDAILAYKKMEEPKRKPAFKREMSQELKQQFGDAMWQGFGLDFPGKLLRKLIGMVLDSMTWEKFNYFIDHPQYVRKLLFGALKALRESGEYSSAISFFDKGQQNKRMWNSPVRMSDLQEEEEHGEIQGCEERLEMPEFLEEPTVPIAPTLQTREFPRIPRRQLRWWIDADIVYCSCQWCRKFGPNCKQCYYKRHVPCWERRVCPWHHPCKDTRCRWYKKKDSKKEDLTKDGDVESNPGPEDDPATENVEVTENLTFVDNREDEAISANYGTTRDVEKAVGENQWKTYMELLGRMIRIKTITWNEQLATNPVRIEIPKVFFEMSSSYQLNIFRSFLFYRPSFEFKFVVNGTKFHCGKVICYVVPPQWHDTTVNHGNTAKYFNTDYATVFPHVFLDAARSNTAHIEVPFNHFMNFFPTVKGLCQSDDSILMGYVMIEEWNKLKYAAGSTAELRIDMFMRFTSCEFHQPINSYEDEFALSRGEIQGGFWEWLAGLPPMFAEKLTGGLSTGLGYRLAAMIFDKPLDHRDAIPIVNRSVYPPCHAVGGDKSIRLALLPFSVTETAKAQVGESIEDYTFKSLMERPSRIFTIDWKATDNECISTWPVTPGLIASQISANKNSVSYYPNMLAYISRGFLYWRGTLKYKFQVVATSFHAGRIMVTFDPSCIIQKAGDQNIDNLIALNSVIVDLEDDSHDFEVETTFMTLRPWLRCDHWRNPQYSYQPGVFPPKLGVDFAGMMSVSVIIPLVCPINVSQEVQINVYVSAGPDLEFAYVNSLHPLTFNYNDAKECLADYSYMIKAPNSKPFTNYADPEEKVYNKEYYWSLYMAGANLFKNKKIGYSGATRNHWYENLEPYNQKLGQMDYETINWLYQLSIMRSDLETGGDKIGFVNDWTAYYLDFPFPAVYVYTKEPNEVHGEAQGETGSDLGEGSSTSTITVTKGRSSADVAPITVAENAMNLQTVLRRYYPVINSYPVGSTFGYTLIRIPVTPAFAPPVLGDIGRYSGTPSIHQVQWYTQLFTYWRGGLRYMINFDNSVLDFYVWHRPTDYFEYGVESGVLPSTIQQNLAFSGTLAIAHLHGSVQVEVPFAQPYTKLLTDHRNQHQDARCQNGTLFLAFRVKPGAKVSMPDPLVYSLFVSTADDFNMSTLRAPPRVDEPIVEYGVGMNEGVESVGRFKSKFGDFIRDCRDGSKQSHLPSSVGYNFQNDTRKWAWAQVDKFPQASTVKGDWSSFDGNCAGAFADKNVVSYALGQKKLMESGDVETNPGPFFEKSDKALESFTLLAADIHSSKEVFDDAMRQVTSIVKEIQDQGTVGNVNAAVSKMNVMLETMSRHSEKLSEMVSSSGDVATRYACMTAEVLCIGAALYNLRRCLEEPKLGNFLSLGVAIAGCFGIACSASVQNLIRSLVNWVLQVPIADERAQAQASYESTADWFFTHEKGVVSSVAVFGTIIYAYIFGVIPPWEKIKAALKDFFEKDEEVTSDRASAQGLDLRAAHFSVLGLTAMDKVYTKMMEYIQRFLDWLFCRDDPQVLLARQAAEVKEEVLSLIKEIDELDINDSMLKALRDPMLHNRYFKLEDRIRVLLKVMMDEKWSAPLCVLINNCSTRISKMLKELQSLHVQPRKRYVPYCLYFTGAAGCGKSSSFPRWIELGKSVMSLADYNLVYAKNIDDEYWSGYCQQPIVIWDEFAGNTDQDDKLGQFMQLNSDQPATVVMADLKDKGMPFLSQMVIVGSNVTYPNPNNIRDLNALHRRRNKLIECRLAEGYTTEMLEQMKPEEGAKFNHIQFRIISRMRERQPGHHPPGRWMHIDELEPIIREDMEAWHEKQLENLANLTPTALPRGVVDIVVNGVAPTENDEIALARQIVALQNQEEDEEIERGVLHIDLAARQMEEAEQAIQGQAHGGEEIPLRVFLKEKAIEFVPAKVQDMSLEAALAAKTYADEKLPKLAVSWALTKMAVVSSARHVYDLVKGYFVKWKNYLVEFWEKHPKIMKAIGILSTFGAVGVAIYIHNKGDAQGNQESRLERDLQAIEGAYQGGVCSQKAVKKVTEGATYDSGPNKRPIKKVVEGCSYDHGPNKRPSKAVTQGSADPVAEGIMRAVHKNVVIISWIGDDSPRLTTRGFRVKGHLLLAPKHFFSHAANGDIFVILANNMYFKIEFQERFLKCSGTDDFVVYDCGPSVPEAKNSIKYFIKSESLGKAEKCPAALMSISKDYTQISIFGTCEGITKYTYDDNRYKEVYKQVGWKTRMSTMHGDCGSILVGFAKELESPGKFLGMHVAGKSDKNEGFSILITQEKLIEVINLFEDDVVGAEIEGLYDDEDWIKMARIVPQGKFSNIGLVPKKMTLTQPMKTTFEKTPWFDEVAAVKQPPKIPAHLHPFINEEGERVSPLAMALAKYGHEDAEPLPYRLLQKITNYLGRTMQHKLDRTQRKIWTINEAVLGIEGCEFADRMNFKSAAGWPYQVLERGKPGKWHLFDVDGAIANLELKHRYEARLEAAKRGERVFSVWRDCLKDELRPREKVAAGKTRLFTIAPVDFTILVRQYFMAFVCAFYSKNCDDFFSAVGINPESYEWTSMYNWLREYGDKCVAGDYRIFDGFMPPWVIWVVCELINMWYNDGPENARIRRVLFAEMIHTYQLIENLVYQTHKGNPSGNPLTVVINTIVCHIYLLLAWLLLCPEYTLDDFYKNVRSIHYGDDFLAVVRALVAGKFNFETIKACLARFGIELTLDTKTEEGEAPFKNLDECTFLKRGFRRDAEFGRTYVLPTMSKDTIESFFYYYRYSADMEGQLQENMRAALVFASFHGRDYYEKTLDKWCFLMSNHGLTPIYVGFEEQVDIFLHGCGALNYEPVKLPVEGKKRAEGMSRFMKITNSRLARAANAIVTAPLYLITAPLGVCSKESDFKRDDDRWAVAIPSGEGKSWLAERYPHIFIDQDDFVLGEFSIVKTIKDGLPWYDREKMRTCDAPSHDRRILLVHHPDNTRRQMIGSFILKRPTFIRSNVMMRLALRNPTKMDRDKRNDYLLRAARELEPELFK